MTNVVLIVGTWYLSEEQPWSSIEKSVSARPSVAIPVEISKIAENWLWLFSQLGFQLLELKVHSQHRSFFKLQSYKFFFSANGRNKKYFSASRT